MPFDGSDQNRVVQAIDRMEALFEGGNRWIQGCAYNGYGRCLVGAAEIAVARDSPTLRQELFDCLSAALPSWMSARGCPNLLPIYNDNCASYAAIEQLLHKAREIAKEKVYAV